jgi:hypothetical protein
MGCRTALGPGSACGPPSTPFRETPNSTREKRAPPDRTAATMSSHVMANRVSHAYANRGSQGD